MPAEVPGQLRSGIPMNEKECFLRIIEHVGHARAAANGLAHLRKDVQWLAICAMLDQFKLNVETLMVKPNGIIIPRNIRN